MLLFHFFFFVVVVYLSRSHQFPHTKAPSWVPNFPFYCFGLSKSVFLACGLPPSHTGLQVCCITLSLPQITNLGFFFPTPLQIPPAPSSSLVELWRVMRLSPVERSYPPTRDHIPVFVLLVLGAPVASKGFFELTLLGFSSCAHLFFPPFPFFIRVNGLSAFTTTWDTFEHAASSSRLASFLLYIPFNYPPLICYLFIVNLNRVQCFLLHPALIHVALYNKPPFPCLNQMISFQDLTPGRRSWRGSDIFFFLPPSSVAVRFFNSCHHVESMRFFFPNPCFPSFLTMKYPPHRTISFDYHFWSPSFILSQWLPFPLFF